jgi:DNA polymerase (family X)
MDNQGIASHFSLLADLMELHGENPFKIKSYQQAGRTLKKMDVSLKAMTIRELEELPGVGKAIAEKIRTLCDTGHLPLLEKYLEITPSGVVDMLQIKGLGPKKILPLWKELHVESLGELYYACIENRITLLKGFGEKTQEAILQNLEYLMQNSGKQLLSKVERKWEQQHQRLKAVFGESASFVPTGAFIRKEQILENVEVILKDFTLEEVKEKLNLSGIPYSSKEESILLQQCDLQGIIILPTRQESFGTHSFISSSTASHIAFVKSRIPGGQIFECENEADIYQRAQLPVFPPEWRHEHSDWFSNPEEQLKGLISMSDIKGIVHTHTVYSDGNCTIAAMSEAGKQMGYEYLVITDHSKTAIYAGGLTESSILQQHAEMDTLQGQLKDFVIFKGIESDILSDGSLDYSDDILKSFDVVIASVHSQLRMDMEKATQRLIKAIENPYTHILGHMTGRLLLSRKGYPLDMMKILDACAANGVSIELNANPHRLDIDWEWIPAAVDKGILISINPDAHNLKGIEDIRYGVYSARRAGLQIHQCLNALDANSFIKKIKSLKG